MRHILITVLLLGTLHSEELTIEQIAKARNFNHSLSGKLRHKRLLKKMAKVSEKEAVEMAKKSCATKEVEFTKLSIRGARLFYLIETQKCTLKIDALDGSLMEKE